MDADMAGEQGGAQAAENNNKERPSRGAGNRIAKKRTKTGCLTCRKRRIKCGEEKPTCGNCMKSKRHCEGYNTRMLFRRNMSDAMDAPDHAQIPFGLPPPFGNPYFPTYFTGHHFMLPGQMPPPPPLAPRPSDEESQFAGLGNGFDPRPLGLRYDTTDDQERVAWMQAMQGPAVSQQLQSPNIAVMPNHQFPSDIVNPVRDQERFDPYDRNNSINPPISPLSQFPGSWENDMKPSIGRNSPKVNDISPLTSHSSEAYGDINENVYLKHIEATQGANGQHTGTPFRGVAHERALSYQDQHGNGAILTPVDSQDEPSQGSNRYRHFSAPTPNDRNYWPDVTHALEQAAVEVEDDDYFDVLSDEEDVIIQAKALTSGSDSQRKLGVMLSLYQQNADELGVRSLDAFIYPGMLDNYRAERVANPLKNPATARVFGHFISSTGPMLSCFERHPKSSAVMFKAGPVRSAQQSLWTYTLPMLALHNQGLLHAMLALGSLHIAKLSAASVTPSYKHYAWSIRRVHGAVSQGKKRHEVTTLAATLLLGFYEVMTADHMKWSTHLYGARQLIIEIDFAGMTRKIKAMKARRSLASLRRSSNNQYSLFDEEEEGNSTHSDSFVDHFPDIDARLVSNLMGRAVRYDEYGRIIDDAAGEPSGKEHVTHAELRNYEVLQDMFWWYCKHDVIHAILSGNKLLMEYDRWAACPPRAPIGVQSAAYGTFDHLILLMGRIAQFTANDRPRKMKVAQVDGTAAPQPTSSSHQGHAPNQSQSQPQASSGFGVSPQSTQSSNSQQSQQPPPFYGMAPMNNNPYMPSAFRPTTIANQDAVDPRSTFTAELEAATASALEEWNSIRSALTIFAESLGPSYQPLSPEEHMPLDTPFGPSASYRGYDIGCVWMTYYLALIIHNRSHPSMPPASTMAVAKAARQTAQYANEIGRIAAGITATLTVNGSGKGGLNPSLAGAFTDCTLPLFFAGVQYQNDAQRRWTARRLRDIEERSGWASAGICAYGCEVSWQRQAMRGGPAYEKDAQPDPKDPCASGRSASGRASMSQQDDRFQEYHTRSQLVGAFGLLGTADDLKRLAVDDSVGSPSASGIAHLDVGIPKA